MSLRKSVHSGHSKTRTQVALCGEKRLQNPASDLRGNSRTVVRNLYPGSAICCTGEHRNPTFTLQGVHGIEEEIHERGHAVGGTNQGQRQRAQLQPQLNPTQSRPADLDRFTDHFVKVCRNRVTLLRRLSAEVSQTLAR